MLVIIMLNFIQDAGFRIKTNFINLLKHWKLRRNQHNYKNYICSLGISAKKICSL